MCFDFLWSLCAQFSFLFSFLLFFFPFAWKSEVGPRLSSRDFVAGLSRRSLLPTDNSASLPPTACVEAVKVEPIHPRTRLRNMLRNAVSKAVAAAATTQQRSSLLSRCLFTATSTAQQQQQLQLLLRRRRLRSTTSSGSGVKAGLSGSDVYESDVANNEYLQFHYATDADLCPFVDSKSEDVDSRYAQALGELMNFPVVCADTLAAAAGVSPSARGGRALDVGCSVGRTTFELTRHFDDAVGVDFSHAFIDTANRLKETGELGYSRIVSGDVVEDKIARVPDEVGEDGRARASFQQGNACALDLDALGGPFDAVVAANLLCRLPEPKAFLTSMKDVVNPGGTVVLISPYSWLEEYTERQKWIGWNHTGATGAGEEGAQLDSFAEVRDILQDAGFELQQRTNIPFVMREHRRKYQLGISECTAWRKKL